MSRNQPADDSTKVGILSMTFRRGVPSTKNLQRNVNCKPCTVTMLSTICCTSIYLMQLLLPYPAMSSKPSTMSSPSTLNKSIQYFLRFKPNFATFIPIISLKFNKPTHLLCCHTYWFNFT